MLMRSFPSVGAFNLKLQAVRRFRPVSSVHALRPHSPHDMRKKAAGPARHILEPNLALRGPNLAVGRGCCACVEEVQQELASSLQALLPVRSLVWQQHSWGPRLL